MTLDEIAIKHGCDKSSLKHDYCRIYEQYISQFEPYWTQEIIKDNLYLNLLEIGYGGYDDPNAGGESGRMWQEAYPNCHITMTDIHPKNNVPAGVFFLLTDVTVPFPWPDEYDKPAGYDVIIDDGSHLNADIIAAFKNLWPVLNPGGLYCIEDTHSSYDPYYADSAVLPGVRDTAMHFFTYLAHSPNIPFIDPVYHIGLYPDIEFIHFYKDLIIIKKAA